MSSIVHKIKEAVHDRRSGNRRNSSTKDTEPRSHTDEQQKASAAKPDISSPTDEHYQYGGSSGAYGNEDLASRDEYASYRHRDVPRPESPPKDDYSSRAVAGSYREPTSLSGQKSGFASGISDSRGKDSQAGISEDFKGGSSHRPGQTSQYFKSPDFYGEDSVGHYRHTTPRQDILPTGDPFSTSRTGENRSTSGDDLSPRDMRGMEAAERQERRGGEKFDNSQQFGEQQAKEQPTDWGKSYSQDPSMIAIPGGYPGDTEEEPHGQRQGATMEERGAESTGRSFPLQQKAQGGHPYEHPSVVDAKDDPTVATFPPTRQSFKDLGVQGLDEVELQRRNRAQQAAEQHHRSTVYHNEDTRAAENQHSASGVRFDDQPQRDRADSYSQQPPPSGKHPMTLTSHMMSHGRTERRRSSASGEGAGKVVTNPYDTAQVTPSEMRQYLGAENVKIEPLGESEVKPSRFSKMKFH